MIIKEHHQGDKDIELADEWLLARAKDIDGDMDQVNFKDRIIANVCAEAQRTRAKRKKEAT